MAKRMLGIYGGTFSPPHIGHVHAAEAFCRAMPLDELLIMPALIPPHKIVDNDASATDRVNMCKLAFSHIPIAKVSELEINRGGKSYTALTLKELCSPETEICFLCGTDMFLTLDTWYDFRTIFKLATICYVRREDDEHFSDKIEEKTKEYIQKYGAKIVPVKADVIEISSTDLRCSISRGVGAEEYISPSVLSYVQERGLYK